MQKIELGRSGIFVPPLMSRSLSVYQLLLLCPTVPVLAVHYTLLTGRLPTTTTTTSKRWPFHTKLSLYTLTEYFPFTFSK